MASQLEKDNALLEEAARTGKCDLSEWPGLCERLVERLDDIAATIFAHAPERAPTPPPSSPDPSANETSTITHPVSPPASSSPSPHPYQPRSPLAQLQEILQTTFSAAPPHTLQRFAELILDPTAHTKSYEKYVRALQRVLSVSSTTEAFPLPANELEVANAFPFSTEDSLGGARLTPIPWLEKSDLTTAVLDGADGTTAENLANGVSQGELLRREQVLDIVPANGTAESNAQEGGAVHEGPEGITAEDVGPQPEGTVFKPAGTPEPEAVKKEEDAVMSDAGPAESGSGSGEAADKDTEMTSVGDDKKEETSTETASSA